MYSNWLLRAVRWAKNPPSPRKVRMALIMLIVLLTIAYLEHVFGWPEFLTVENTRRPRF